MAKNITIPKIVTDAWNRIYGAQANSPNGLSCTQCSTTLFGDGPTLNVVCTECMARNSEFGMVQPEGGCICQDCLCELPEDELRECVEDGDRIDPVGWPDGYTCDICGECQGC